MANRYDRRTFLGTGAKTAAGLAIVGGAGSLLSACGGSGSSGPSTFHGNSGGIGTGTPVYGGSLIFGTEADEAGFDPTTAHFDSTGVLYARTIYDPLAIPSRDGKTVYPYLAESITPNADSTQWQITLRPNLFFHDGTPCNADALYFCLNAYVKSPLVNFALTYVKGLQKISDLTVQVNMNAPWVPFPAWLCGYIGGQVAYVFSPTQFKKPGLTSGESLLNSHPVGTGPFIFKEWVPNDHFTATRNPHYWRKDAAGRQLPYLNSITYKPLPIVAERWTGLQTGTLDIIHTDDDRTILDIRSDHNLYDVEDVDSPVEHDMDFGMINTSMAPLDDIRIRQSLAYGFNQANYLAVQGFGVTQPTDGPFTKTSQYYAPTGYPKYDLAKAQSLFRSYQADHGGKPVAIQYGITNTPTSVSSASLVQQYYQAIGFEVTVTQVEQSALIDDAIFGNYHVFGWRQFANIDPDLNYVFWSSQVPAGDISVNFTRLHDPVVQHNLDIGRQSSDQSTRNAAYQAIGAQFGQQCCYIWVDEDVWCIGAQKTVQNFNNPTTVAHQPALQMLSGIIWPTEIWKTAS